MQAQIILIQEIFCSTVLEQARFGPGLGNFHCQIKKIMRAARQFLQIPKDIMQLFQPGWIIRIIVSFNNLGDIHCAR